jgi:hypothetical protein
LVFVPLILLPGGETDEVFVGYGLLSGPDIVRLTDGELAVT